MKRIRYTRFLKVPLITLSSVGIAVILGAASDTNINRSFVYPIDQTLPSSRKESDKDSTNRFFSDPNLYYFNHPLPAVEEAQQMPSPLPRFESDPSLYYFGSPAAVPKTSEAIPVSREIAPPTATPSATKPVHATPPENLPKALNETQQPPSAKIVREPPPLPPEVAKRAELATKTILINFNNVSITEYIRFVSRISSRNFVFDENDLQFTVTIVSEEPTTIENIMTALLQELRIHGLDLLDDGSNLIIHKNPAMGSLSTVVTGEGEPDKFIHAQIITQVFRLNTVEADKAAAILKPMLSDKALIEVLKETNQLIITDLVANIREIIRLLKSIDAPQSGLVIGQYVVRNGFAEPLVELAKKIMQPIAADQPLNFVAHGGANSIFIVSNPYLVERTLSVLQYLDQTQGTTQILNPKEMRFGVPSAEGAQGQWRLNENGEWEFVPAGGAGLKNLGQPPQGQWVVDPQGNWYFQPGAAAGGGAGLQGPNGAPINGPLGGWMLNPQGVWVFQLAHGESISPQRLVRAGAFASELPPGHIERTKFYIHKLKYRNGDQIATSLSKIGLSLQQSGASNVDLISTINSVQWLESSNSLVFTGPPDALAKVEELVLEIDTPLRQVFLEMLIISMSLDDSLTFSINPGARFGGGNSAGSEAFLSGATTLPQALDTTAIGFIPDASGMARVEGFDLGVIGRTITHNGTEFASLGILVRALHTKTRMNIIMNPKILTEDNNPAEIFVGENTQFPTQSIANDRGSIVTQNFEFRDVGTRLKVTPLISSDGMITLDIQEEVSAIISGGTSQINNLSNQVIGPTTSVNRTTTKVHLPNGYFLVLSGMLQDTQTRTRKQMPCLGGAPLLGALFSDKLTDDAKANLMIFIRPMIIDTQEEMDWLTKHEQDIYRVKCRRPDSWKFETTEALDFLNLIDTDNSDGEEDCY